MQKLTTVSSEVDAVTLISFLESYNIPAHMSQGPKHMPEVWIAHDEDAKTATEALKEWVELQKEKSFVSPSKPITFKKILAIIFLLGFTAVIITMVVNLFQA